MKIKALIVVLFVSFGAVAQHVIKVKKSQTITGVFYWEEEDKTKDYLFFTEEGVVYIMENTKKKPKKALKYMKSCVGANCSDIRVEGYAFEKNVINFSFESTAYVKDYSGMFEDAGTKIVFKVSETGQLMVVREYERIE